MKGDKYSQLLILLFSIVGIIIFYLAGKIWR